MILHKTRKLIPYCTREQKLFLELLKPCPARALTGKWETSLTPTTLHVQRRAASAIGNLKAFFNQHKLSEDRKAVKLVMFIPKAFPFTLTLGQSTQRCELGSCTVGMMSAMEQSIGMDPVSCEIQNLPLPSHAPIMSFQHSDSTPLILKIGWTRAVPSQRSCGQGRLQPRQWSQPQPQPHLLCSWVGSQIPIKNLDFPKNSEQPSPEMSRCWALLSARARAFSKGNRLFNIKNSK